MPSAYSLMLISFPLSLFLKGFILSYSIWHRGDNVLAPEIVKIICHSSSCNSSYSVLKMTGQILMRKGMPSRDGCIQHPEEGQHNYINTPTSHDAEQTPADLNGRREDYSFYNQLLCPVNLPLTSASLFNPLPTQPLLVHKTYDACFLPWAPICWEPRRDEKFISDIVLSCPIKISSDTQSRHEIITAVLKVLHHTAVSLPTNTSLCQPLL